MGLPREPKKLSVVIPARDEEVSITATVTHLHHALQQKAIPHEILVVDDGSKDRSWEILQDLKRDIPVLRALPNPGPHGFGRAVQIGLRAMQGDAVVIMMADESDDCRDVLRYWDELKSGADCVFGSRFLPGSAVYDYPLPKLVLNRLANLWIRILFRHGLNDTTNAFKAYRREVIEGVQPLLSPHFNLTVELPLKAVVRGYHFRTIPITWRNRKTGRAKFRIQEMGSRYLFIVLYVWLEKYFSRGDYHRKTQA